MKNRIIVIFTLFAGLFLLNSCLKDTADYWPDQVSGKMYATVLKPSLQAMALEPNTDTVSFSFMINIATDQPPTSDVTVTVAQDPTAVDNYNTINKPLVAFKSFPAENWKIENPTVTIKAGTRTAYVNGKVWGADKLNACDNFIAATTIKSVSDANIVIPGNMKSYMLSLPINNPYAGNYQVDGYRIRPGNAPEPVSAIEAFNTVNCTTVKKNGFGNYGSYDIKIEVTAETIVVDGDNCLKVIATPVDGNGVSVGGMFTSWNGDAATPPAAPTNPTDINYYNPSKRFFVLNCYYNSTAGNRIMYEKCVRQ